MPTFVNRNVCKTFVYTFASTNVESLSTLGSQECSQVSVRPRTNAAAIYDPQNPSVGYDLLANEEFVFCGLTNLSSLSAKGSTGSKIQIRTQYYGNTIM
jgi:hypothetical protein